MRLDHEKINAARWAALWESGAMTCESLEECDELIEEFSRKDEDGKYAPFCDAILYYLRKYRE